MPRRRKGAPPPYLHHKATGMAYSTLFGQQVYHGPWNTKESRRAYKRFLERWEREYGVTPKADGTIAGLAYQYLAEVASLLSRPERTNFKANLRDLTNLYGAMRPEDFGAAELKHLRSTWVSAGLARQTVNKQVGRVRRVFRWGRSEDLVSMDTLNSIESLDDLKAGRTEARDYSVVLPVPLRHLARTLKFMTPKLKAMVLTQYYVGARPGEVCAMRSDEIHRKQLVVVANGVARSIPIPEGSWAFQPTQHKNVGKGKALAYLIGPRVQRLLLPYLANRCLFDVRPDTYGKNIGKACVKAGVPHWTPNQLRHNWFTRTTRIAGIAAASEAGGHASLNTTLIYLERNLRAAAELARRHG